MAGFMGIPIGTIGTRPGATDFSPYLRMRQLQIAAEEQARAQAQQQAQFDATMGQRASEFDFQKQQAKAELDFKMQEADRAKSRYELEYLNREEQQKQQAEMQKSELDLRTKEQADVAQARTEAAIERKTEFEAGQKVEARQSATADGESFARQMFGRSDVGTDFNAIDSSAAAWAKHDYPDDPLAQKAYVNAASKMFAKLNAERQAQERQRADYELAKQSEERKALKDKAELEIANRQIEQYDQAKKQEAASKASAPFRKQQESVVRAMNEIAPQVAAVEGLLKGATPDKAPFYQNILVGLQQALDRLKAQYDELGAKASAREAEVLARS